MGRDLVAARTGQDLTGAVEMTGEAAGLEKWALTTLQLNIR